MLFDVFKAILLGVVEGLTEFLPVSSTGHLLLVDHFFGPEPDKQAFWDSFNVLIQFGAILALLTIYFTRLWKIAIGMFTNPDDRRFVIGASDRIPARRGDRRAAARLHQGRAVQRVDRLRHADRRRRGADLDREAAAAPALS